MNILCLGDISLDTYINKNKSFFGGCSVNVARQLYEVIGHKQTSLYVPLGTDQNSEEAKSFLESLKFEVRYKVLEGPCPGQPISIDENGERHFHEYIEGVLPKFTCTDLGGFFFKTKDLIIFPYFKQVEKMVSSLLKLCPKAKLACDFGNLSDYDGNLTHISELLPKLSYAQFSGEPSSKFRDEFFSTAALNGDLVLIDTYGSQGARAYYKDKVFNSPAPEVYQVTDSTGAGDAFMAHFSYSYFALEKDLQTALNLGCEGGSKQVSHLGPGPLEI